jgi:nucleoside-specific outer membrane channel protein Tsx
MFPLLGCPPANPRLSPHRAESLYSKITVVKLSINVFSGTDLSFGLLTKVLLSPLWESRRSQRGPVSTRLVLFAGALGCGEGVVVEARKTGWSCREPKYST